MSCHRLFFLRCDASWVNTRRRSFTLRCRRKIMGVYLEDAQTLQNRAKENGWVMQNNAMGEVCHYCPTHAGE